MTILKYIGNGRDHIPGIPARDLLQADIDGFIDVFLFKDQADAINQLTAHGLYSAVKPKTKAKPKTVKAEDIEG